MSSLHQRFAYLSNDEVKRYSRHVIMPEVGMEGQRRLKASSVLLIGTGGLRQSARACIWRRPALGASVLVDYDLVDFTNLQRQVIHGVSTVGAVQAGQRGSPHAGPEPRYRVSSNTMSHLTV